MRVRTHDHILTKVKAVPHCRGEATGKCLSKTQIRGIHKLLRCAFGFAAEMELIADNPFAKIKAPRASYKKREAWTPDTIQRALNLCKDNRLFMAINLAFACSMRIGEVLGLTWDNIHISSDDMEQGNAHLFIEKELQRASLESIQKLKSEDIFYIFEPFKKNNVTRLLLKTPKTESSVRRVWIPEMLADMLISWRDSQERLEEFLGDEYRRYAGGDGREYKFVIALNDGSPCEERIITKAFEKLITKNGLPRVVFHSLRKSSATYKLKESGGDIKSVQGDGGWAEPDMVTKTYSEIIDEDRKVNAHRFNKSFYSGFVMNNEAPTSKPLLISDGNKVSEPMSQNEVLELLELFQQNPELLKVLELAQSQPDITKILLTLRNTKKHLDL